MEDCYRTGYGSYYGANQTTTFSDAAESAVPLTLELSRLPRSGYPLLAFLDPKNHFSAESNRPPSAGPPLTKTGTSLSSNSCLMILSPSR